MVKPELSIHQCFKQREFAYILVCSPVKKYPSASWFSVFVLHFGAQNIMTDRNKNTEQNSLAVTVWLSVL